MLLEDTHTGILQIVKAIALSDLIEEEVTIDIANNQLTCFAGVLPYGLKVDTKF